ncbi:MAG: hypothetical protein ABL897_02365 [Hyphomicrobium sp.]
MKNLLCAASLSLAAVTQVGIANAETTPSTDLKITKAQCETLWKQALGSSAGDLPAAKAAAYAPDTKKVDINSDGKIQPTEWMDGCNKGLIKTAAANSPSSEPGGATSDRTPGGATERTPGATSSGAAGTDAGQTPSGTSDRTPSK